MLGNKILIKENVNIVDVEGVLQPGKHVAIQGGS
jgi:hypothetical protein